MHRSATTAGVLASGFAIIAILWQSGSASVLSVEESNYRTAWHGENTTAMCSPLHVIWAHGIDLSAAKSKSASRHAAGEAAQAAGPADSFDAMAISVPPFPRNAAANPMHALLDHIGAVATLAENCALLRKWGDDANTRVMFVIHGMSRQQVKAHESSSELRPNFPDVDQMKGAPTWGQWVLYLYAVSRVGESNVLFSGDMLRPTFFAKGVLCFQFDYWGLYYREFRMEYELHRNHSESRDHQSKKEAENIFTIPRPEIPEEWKRLALRQVRGSVLEKLKISTGSEAPRGSFPIRLLIHTRMGSRRRRWHNYEDSVKAIQNEFGSHELDISIHHGYGFQEHQQQSKPNFRDQVVMHNRADIVIAPHGAGIANSAFMRNGTRLIEIWRCCFEDPVSGKELGPWTGWLHRRLGLDLVMSYLPCRGLDASRTPIPRPDNNPSVCDDLESNFLHPSYIEVDPSFVVSALKGSIRKRNVAPPEEKHHAAERTNWESLHQARRKAGPKNGGTASIARPRKTLRWAPVGPSWTERATWSPKEDEEEASWLRQRRVEAHLEWQYWQNHSQWAEALSLHTHQGEADLKPPPRPPVAMYDSKKGTLVKSEVYDRSAYTQNIGRVSDGVFPLFIGTICVILVVLNLAV